MWSSYFWLYHFPLILQIVSQNKPHCDVMIGTSAYKQCHHKVKDIILPDVIAENENISKLKRMQEIGDTVLEIQNIDLKFCQASERLDEIPGRWS